MEKSRISMVIAYISTIMLATCMIGGGYTILHFSSNVAIRIGVAFVISGIFFLTSIISSVSSLFITGSRLKEEAQITVAMIIFVLGCIFYFLMMLSVLYRV